MQKVNQSTRIQRDGADVKKGPPKSYRDITETHTKKWIFPPFMITIAKRCLKCFQPQERI